MLFNVLGAWFCMNYDTIVNLLTHYYVLFPEEEM